MALLAIAFGIAWFAPSSSYLLLPDEAKPLADLVEVEGERPDDEGGIYYVDVVVRKASLLEEQVGALRPEGADVVPEHAIVPPGSSFQERRQRNLQAMDLSQQIAAAVALRELGYEVDSEPEGALVVAVASDAPAAGKLEATDVIVGVDGSVAPVGGVAQKTIGARRAGADVFLVPAGDNAAVARRNANGLRVIAVESFQQALQALATLPEKAS